MLQYEPESCDELLEVMDETSYRFDEAPLVIHWEATRACDLACIHCRADAVRHRHPGELTTAEARAMLEEIGSFPTRRQPHVVITGGDPLRRPDLVELIRYGTERGLSVSTTPAGTPRFTPDIVKRLKAAGVSSLALSLDGSDAERHDSFRQERGSFGWTLDIARAAIRQGVPLQINTMVTAETAPDLPQIYRLLHDIGISRWVLFFLITTGRGWELQEVSPSQGTELLTWLAELADSRETPFPVKTTEAPHFRRIYSERRRSAGATDHEIRRSALGYGFGVRDGNGVVFVSHTGDVYPSGFLPIRAGSVRERPLPEIYRNAPIMKELRDVQRLRGRCGECPMRAICGGSRARSYAVTGDPFASDPLCNLPVPVAVS